MPIAVYKKVRIYPVLSVCTRSLVPLVVLRPPLCAVAICADRNNKAIHLGRSNDAGDLSAVDKNASPVHLLYPQCPPEVCQCFESNSTI